MDCTKVGVFQEADQIVLCSFLQSHDHMHLEAQIIFTDVLGNFVDQMQNRGTYVCMRTSVLFWNQQILWRATIPGWYFQGLFSMPAFKNSFLGALPPTVSQSFFQAGSSPADVNGPASVAICTSCLVGNEHGYCPTSSNFLTSSLHLSTLPGVGRPLLSFGLPVPELLAVLGPLFLFRPITLPAYL